MRRKRVRRSRTQPRYQVDVIINEKETKAFADTGADVSVMSEKNAKKLGLELSRTRMKIKPYGSNSYKCKGCYIGTIMFGEIVENVVIYVVKQNVETLLSRRVSEALGIIKFCPDAHTNDDIKRTTSDDPTKTKLVAAFPKVFNGKVGTLKNYEVKFHVDETVTPIAERHRP